VRPSPCINDELTREPSRKKARWGDDGAQESRSLPDYASNRKEADDDVDKTESRNLPDYASNHKEADGDVDNEGSQALWNEALEEAVQLYRSTPKRTTEGRGSQWKRSQDAWGPGHGEAKYPQSSMTEQEGCHVEALDCTSTREVPPRKQPRGTSPGSSGETILVSRYIKEEDEIDYPTEGAVELGGDSSVTMSTLSIQDQVVDHVFM
jgi:hypothetical protein